MTARALVLGRIRAALADTTPDGATPDGAAVPRDYRRHGELPPGDPGLVDVLTDRLRDYHAHVHRTDDVADTVAAILAANGARPSVVVPPGLHAEWLPDTVEAVRDDNLSAERLAALDGVVTAAAVAIAETGTIVLDGSADQGRRIITLLPDLHICIVGTDQIVAGVPEALTRVAAHRPQTWISGPSATSDIELDRVEGVHGPRRLHVIVTNRATASGGATPGSDGRRSDR
jgi:L-lactate dehydrogenase complex protein LldG